MNIIGSEYSVIEHMIENKIYPTVVCVKMHGSDAKKIAAWQKMSSIKYEAVCVKMDDYTFVRTNNDT